MYRLLLFAVLAILFIIACKTRPQSSERKQSPLTLCAPRAFDALAEPVDNLPLFPGLGKGSFSITTASETAQAFFDQGFKFTVAFNHMEAVRSFRYALKEDPECAMCHWGLAYALGPNYNAAFDPAVLAVANDALAKARQFMENATEKEKDLIRAMSRRYPAEVAEDQVPYEQAYADALKKLTRKYPGDLDIGAMYVEALMNLHPWDLWEQSGAPRPWTPEIIAHLEDILARDPDHVATIHLYIHATEASQNPHRAVPYAEKLKKLTPGAGHLVHMPSHSYIRTGDYYLGVQANADAVAVDSQYLSACHAAGAYPLAYYPHNFHFLAACAAFGGDSRTAIDASRRMVAKLDTIAMRQPGLETIQHYYAIPYYVLVKFSKWDEVLGLPRPAKDLGYPTAIWRYARGMAYTAKGDLTKARNELANLQLLQQEAGLRELTIWDINRVGELLDIAALVLEGEMAAAQGDFNRAVDLLSRAVAIEDGLAYNEPPDWFFSVRHHLGPVLLAKGDFPAAEALFRRDLELFPKNGFALHGLYDSLQKQGRYQEARAVQKRFQKAFEHADVKLEASRVLS